MNLDLHPIQLKDLKFVQLHAKAFSDPSGISETEIDFRFHVSTQEFEQTTRVQLVKVTASLEHTENCPIEVLVETVGIFCVSEQFPQDKLDSWSKKNAPLIMMPYIREAIHSLATRMELPQIILPLFQVPTLIVEKP